MNRDDTVIDNRKEDNDNRVGNIHIELHKGGNYYTENTYTYNPVLSWTNYVPYTVLEGYCHLVLPALSVLVIENVLLSLINVDF